MELIFGMWVPYGEDKKPIDFCGIPRSLEVNKCNKTEICRAKLWRRSFLVCMSLLVSKRGLMIFVKIKGHLRSTEVKNCNLQSESLAYLIFSMYVSLIE